MAIEKLRNFTESEKQEFYRLVAELEGTGMHPDAIKLATTARAWFDKGWISSKEKVHLCDWCNYSDDPRKHGREVAGEISMLVFGKVITEYD